MQLKQGKTSMILRVSIALLICIGQILTLRSKWPNYVQIACILPNDSHKYSYIPKVQPALELANDKVKELGLIPNHRLYFTFADSRCSATFSQIEAIDFYMEGKTRAFFGPVCDYAAAAIGRINWHWDIPLLTPGALAHDYGANKTVPGAEFPMVTRVGVSFDSMSGFVVKILQEFRWTRIKVLYEKDTSTEVMNDRFGYLAMTAVYEEMVHHGLFIGTEEGSSFLEMPPNHNITEILQNEVGVKYAGKSTLLCYN